MESDVPPSTDEVERMILALYEPSAAETVAKVQETLHHLQQTRWAWPLARELMGRSDEKVRFFGALTLETKLNSDSASLNDEDQRELLIGLFGWLVDSAANKTVGLVTRKLCTALVTYFLRFPHQSRGCIKRLAWSLQWRQNIDDADKVELPSVLEAMEPTMLLVVLMFATDLVEQSAKVDVDSAKNFQLYESLRSCVPDVVSLVDSGLRRMGHGNGELEVDKAGEAAVKCLQAWSAFASRAFAKGDALVDSLRSLIPKLLDQVTSSPRTLVTSMELFSELLSAYPAFLLPSHVDALFGVCATSESLNLHQRLLGGDFGFDCLQHALFLLALGEARMDQLLGAVDQESQGLLCLLYGLLEADGWPVVEHTIFVPSVEFWSSFSEAVSDARSLDEETWLHDMAVAASYATRAAETACRRVAFPPDDVTSLWDSSERDGFQSARLDVADLLQSVYSFSGPALAMTLAQLVPGSLARAAWADAEAALFSLGSLAECIQGDSASDGALSLVFTGEAIAFFANEACDVPARVRRAFISAMDKLASYFERKPENLAAALNLLFMALRDPTFSSASSKSIHRLCSSCREGLVPEARAFLAQVRALFAEGGVDCLALERVIGGTACVVQAIPSELDRLGAVDQLVDMLRSAMGAAFEGVAPGTSLLAIRGEGAPCGQGCFTSSGHQQLPLHNAVKVLRSFLGLARGLRAPEDAFVDLEPAPSLALEAVAGPAKTELGQVNSRIMAALTTLQRGFQGNMEVVETICSTIRAGFTEPGPAPFVFAPGIVVDYLVSQSGAAPGIGVLAGTACAFVSSQTVKRDSATDDLGRLLSWICRLLVGLADVEHDPELAVNGIDFVCRLLLRDASLVMCLEPKELLGSFFSFTMHVLDSREPLPKAQAADFWATFASCKPPNDGHGLVPQAMRELGPAVTLALVRNIGGNASRSEVTKLGEPIKKLVAQHPMAATWIETALFHDSFPSQKVSSHDKRVFVQRLVSLRGARTTNQVIRDFWLSSRGTSFTYVS